MHTRRLNESLTNDDALNKWAQDILHNAKTFSLWRIFEYTFNGDFHKILFTQLLYSRPNTYSTATSDHITSLGQVYLVISWLVRCFGFKGFLKQYLSLHRAVSHRGRKKREKID